MIILQSARASGQRNDIENMEIPERNGLLLMQKTGDCSSWIILRGLKSKAAAITWLVRIQNSERSADNRTTRVLLKGVSDERTRFYSEEIRVRVTSKLID